MSTPFIQANTNGRIHPASEPSISPLNRGFLYGDAIYEVWRTYEGVIFAWTEHWNRLLASAEALHIPLPFGPDEIIAEIRRTTAAFREAGGTGELYIRLQVTRGAGAIGLDVALADRPDFVLLVQPCPALSPAGERGGLNLSLATRLRRNPVECLDPAWKTGNYLNNLLCLREALSRGADEVVILNLAGEITEAAVSNIAFVRDGVLITPPVSAGILKGVTRGLVLERVAARAGIRACEETVRPSDLPAIQECMLMSTTKDIVPVASVDEHRFAVSPATVTSRLKTAFAEMCREYVRRHAGWAV